MTDGCFRPPCNNPFYTANLCRDPFPALHATLDDAIVTEMASLEEEEGLLTECIEKVRGVMKVKVIPESTNFCCLFCTGLGGSGPCTNAPTALVMYHMSIPYTFV